MDAPSTLANEPTHNVSASDYGLTPTARSLIGDRSALEPSFSSPSEIALSTPTRSADEMICGPSGGSHHGYVGASSRT
jgi:hypothetical protein